MINEKRKLIYWMDVSNSHSLRVTIPSPCRIWFYKLSKSCWNNMGSQKIKATSVWLRSNAVVLQLIAFKHF